VKNKKAVVLLSGGLDSATTLAVARSEGFAAYALTFNYGQRHRRETEAAEKIANSLGVIEHRCRTVVTSLTGRAEAAADVMPAD